MLDNRPSWRDAAYAVVLLFAVMGWRVKKQQSEISDIVYRGCSARAVATEKLNTFNAGMMKIERENPFQLQGAGQAKIAEKRIALYRAAILDVPECVKP